MVIFLICGMIGHLLDLINWKCNRKSRKCCMIKMQLFVHFSQKDWDATNDVLLVEKAKVRQMMYFWQLLVKKTGMELTEG